MAIRLVISELEESGVFPKEDIARMQRVCSEHGYVISAGDAERVWLEYSKEVSTYTPGWARLPEKDLELLSILWARTTSVPLSESLPACDHGEDKRSEYVDAFDILGYEVYRCECGALINIQDEDNCCGEEGDKTMSCEDIGEMGRALVAETLEKVADEVCKAVELLRDKNQ